MSGKRGPAGPNLTAGVALADAREGGMIGGHVGGEDVLVARRDGKLLCVSATCTHYGGPLDKGLIVGGTVQWPPSIATSRA